MKKLSVAILFFVCSVSVFAQEKDSTSQAEQFEFEWAGEKRLMQKYFIVILKSGSAEFENAQKAAALQRQHLEYLGDLFQEGTIILNGPTDGEGEIRGFSVYSVPKIEDAKKLAENDPLVKAGHLKIEVLPWWLAKGSIVE